MVATLPGDRGTIHTFHDWFCRNPASRSQNRGNVMINIPKAVCDVYQLTKQERHKNNSPTYGRNKQLLGMISFSRRLKSDGSSSGSVRGYRSLERMLITHGDRTARGEGNMLSSPDAGFGKERIHDPRGSTSGGLKVSSIWHELGDLGELGELDEA